MANKKINQLVSKTAILSTDLFGIGDATTGQLFKKTIAELQAAIGGAVISVNGLVGTVVLDTDDIQELATPTNKYFTDARARGAISLTVTGNSGASTYSSGTGVLNVPTYTLAGLGGITASFLSGTSGISYNSTTGVISYSGTVYTDSSIRALLSGGTGISYNSSTGAISYSGTVYTDSSVRALISMTTTGTSGASTYNNTTGVINVPEYTLAGLGGISLTSLSGGTGITYNNTTGAISYSGTVYTDASVRALISATSPISYNSTTGVISLTGGNLTEATSSVLTITGGSGAVIGGGTSIQVKQATTSVSGFLSSTDWTTFNNKQATISLTTTGTSGAATFSANTLNIPNYGSALSGYLPLTGGTLTGALIGTSATFSATVRLTNFLRLTKGSSSVVYDSSSNVPRFETAIINTESGSNIGSDFAIYSYNDAGSFLASPLIITRSTGAATFSSSVTATGLIVNTSSQFTAGGTAVNSIYASGPSTFGISSSDSIYLRRYDVGQYQFQTVSSGASGGNLSLQSYGGNVGIGTTSPTHLLHAVGTSNWIKASYSSSSDTRATEMTYAGIKTTASTSQSNNMQITMEGGYTPDGSGSIVFHTGSPTASERMRITSGGIVEINNTDACYINFKTSGTSKAFIGLAGTSSDVISGAAISDIVIRAQQKMLFSTGGDTERMRITSGGNILMGTTTDNGEKLYVSGAIRATGTITANSDLTLKKNLLKIENALEKVEKINGYTYEFKEDDSKRHAGVIAQEIQTVLPEIVNKGNDGILGVEYGNISALLIEAIKEQQTQINELKALLNK